MPYERSLEQKYKDKLQIVGVNSDANPQQALARMQAENSEWPSFYDGGSNQGPLAKSWNIQFWPTTYIIDHRGVIRYKGLQAPQFEAAVAALVAEQDRDAQQRVAAKKTN